MIFGAPIWLWSLGLIPVLGGLYFLKVRPRRQPTTALFLWEKVFQKSQSKALFKRLRDLWSLLLLLLVFILVAFAISEPKRVGQSEADLIIILDTSASMGAKGAGANHLEAAKAEAIALVRGLNGTRRAAIATVDREVRFHTHLSAYPKELLDAVETIQVSDLPLDTNALETLIRSRSGDIDKTYFYLLTNEGAELKTLPDGLRIVHVGAPLNNLGIVAADLQWQPGSESAAALYVRIQNSGTEAIESELALTNVASGAIVKLQPFTVLAGAVYEEVLTMEPIEAGLWSARLTKGDALAADNEVLLSLYPVEPIAVGLMTENKWFFENCVRAFELSGSILKLVSRKPEIIVVESGTANNLSIHALVFTSNLTEAPWWDSIGAVLPPVVPEVKITEHPVLRYLDVANMRFAGARELVIPDTAVVIVASELGVPLLYKITQAGISTIVANMNPAEADFFLSPWFPVLVHAAAEHLAGKEGRLRSVYATGSRFPLPSSAVESWSVMHPSGQTTERMPGDLLVLNELGSYQISRAGNSLTLGTGLLSTQESAVLEAPETYEELTQLASGWPLSVWFLVLAILLLSIESILYNRRKVG